MHYGEIAERKEYKPDLVIHCKRWACAHYGEWDDGEDEQGNPYPPCPFCSFGDKLVGLWESWMGEEECVGEFERRED